MGPLVIMVVLVCGFWFTENHYQSRIRQARTNGWTSYFYVAMHGCKFVIQGFCLILFIYLFLLIVSLIISIPHLFVSTYGIKDFYSWLTNKTALSYPLFFILSLRAGCFIAWRAGDAAQKLLFEERVRQAA